MELEIPGTESVNYYSCTYPFRAEFIAKAGLSFQESCIDAEFYDRTRDVRLLYDKHQIFKYNGGEKLSITLKDEYYPLTVILHYTTYEVLDLISNCGKLGKRISEGYDCSKPGQIYYR